MLACTNFVGFFCCSLIPEPMQLPLELSCHTESWFGRVIGGRTGYTLQNYKDGAQSIHMPLCCFGFFIQFLDTLFAGPTISSEYGLLPCKYLLTSALFCRRHS